MATWNDERKKLGIIKDDYSAGLQTVDKNAGVDSWTLERIKIGALPDTRPSTQLKQQLPDTVKNAMNGNFSGTTLFQAAQGNKTALQDVQRATGIDLTPKALAPAPTTTGTSGNYSDIYNQRKAEIANGGTARSFFGNSIYDNVIAPFATGANYLAYGNPLGALVSRTGNSAASLTGPAVAPKPSVGVPFLDKTADVAGTIAGFGFNPAGVGAVGQGLISAPYKIADQTLSKGLGGYITKSAMNAFENPNTGRIANNLITNAYRGTIAGGITGASTSLLRDESSAEQVGSAALLGAGLGGIGDVAFSGIGAALRSKFPSIYERFSSQIKPYENALQNNYQLKSNFNANNINRNASLATEGLSASRSKLKDLSTESTPTTARIEQVPNVYRTKFENLMKLANDTKFTKGKEEEELSSLWKTVSEKDDPDLFKLIDLAYPVQKNKITPDLLSRAKLNQQKREVYGVPLPVKSVSKNDFPKNNQLNENNNVVAIKADDYHMLDDVETPVTPVIDNVPAPQRVDDIPSARFENQTPTNVPVANERGFISTLADSDKTPDAFTQQLRQSDAATYDPITNQATLNQANARLDDISQARSYVMNDTKFSAEKAATAQRLIDHYNSRGMTNEAVEVAEKLAKEATDAGQFIQALSMYNRLTPEGTLKFVNKRVDSINEKLPTKKAKIVVDDETKRAVIESATIGQKMTGIKNLSNDVIDIVTRAKNGESLSASDTEALKQFVQETKSFVKDATGKKNTVRADLPTNPRKRDQVISFLDAHEQAAKERIEARKNRLSSTPLDVWADYAIIGASKLGKGTVKFSDWSESMVKDLGEDIRPILPNLYERAKQTFNDSKKQVTRVESEQAVKLVNKVIKDKKLEGSDADALLVTARKIASLSGEEKKMASQELQKILQSFDRPGILRKLSSGQTIAQLLNVKTQVRNILGNELFYATEQLNKLVATPIDIARSKITGKERYVTFKKNNQMEYWSNWMKGAKAGWDGTNINGLQSQFDLNAQAFKWKYNPLTYLEKALGASLRSFDNASYMRAYNHTLGEMGTLEAVNKGITGKQQIKEYVQNYISNADEKVLQFADDYGRYVTFQDNNALSMGLSKLKRGLNLNKDFGVGDLVLKYPKTPGALLMRAFEYSPAGILRSLYLANRGLRYAEKENLPQATLALSRAIIGTGGFGVAGFILMDNGVLTTAASKDRDVRSLAASAGQSDYQINFTALKRFIDSGFEKQDTKTREGDFLYTYDWAQPVALSFSVGAEANKNIKEGKEADKLFGGVAGVAVNSLAGGINTLTEQSVLSGIKEAAQGYPGQTATDKVLKILSTLPASFVPTAVNQWRQIKSNEVSETYSPNLAEQSLNQTNNRFPGAQNRLPAKFDSLGQPVKKYQNDSLFNILVNPGEASRYKLSPNAQLVMDLINETDDESLAPRVPLKSWEGIKFTGEQYSRLSEVQGQIINEGISQIDPTYPPEIKAKVLDQLYDRAGKEARQQIVQEFNLVPNREK